MTLEEKKKESCEWCRMGISVDQKNSHVVPESRWESAVIPCTAPPREDFESELSTETCGTGKEQG